MLFWILTYFCSELLGILPNALSLCWLLLCRYFIIYSRFCLLVCSFTMLCYSSRKFPQTHSPDIPYMKIPRHFSSPPKMPAEHHSLWAACSVFLRTDRQTDEYMHRQTDRQTRARMVIKQHLLLLWLMCRYGNK